MRKIMVLLLIVGLIIGTFSAAEVLCEDDSSSDQMDFMTDEGSGDNGNPAPCGGGGSGSGPNPG